MSRGRRVAKRIRNALRPTLSIRARLLVLAVLAVAPLMFDRIRLLEANRTEHIVDAYNQAMVLARQRVEAQQEIIVAARAVLQVVARAHAATVKSGETCNRLFSEIAFEVPWLNSLSVIGLDGRIVCSTFPNAAGLNLSDRDYFQQAVRTGNFVLSDYLVGRLRNGPTVVAALPTRDPDQAVTGVINAAIDLHWIGRLTSVVKEHPGAMAIVVDGKGTLLARHPDSDTWLGRQFPDDPLIKVMLERAEGTITTTGLDGVRRMFAFCRLSGTDAHIAVGLDEGEVLGRINNEMWIAYAQLAIICAGVLFGVWFGGERLIIQPIRSLARSATRIGLGNLDTRLTDKPWAPEFAPLAAALENMARKLAAREDEFRFANDHLEELASIDGLSGLANRRGFDANLGAEWQRASLLRRPVALLMIDVDHFKLFNDNHGHVEGDECLRAVGEVITTVALDGSYFAARYGGEEFVLLLPGADIDTAVAAGERLRRAIADLRIVNSGAPSGLLTISIGVASLDPQPSEQAGILVEAADAALYAAKRNGRNTVVAHATPAFSEAG